MSSNNRIIIFCESYPSIAYTLYRLTNETSNVPTTIFIPALKDLYQLFQVINEKVFNNRIELVYCPQYTPRWTTTKGLKKLLFLIPDILDERRYLKKFYNDHFAGLENAEVLFPSPGYSGAKIYVLKKLSRRNRLVFIDPGPPYMARYSPRGLNDLFTLLIYKLVYGHEVQLGQFPPENPWSTGFPLMPARFLRNHVRDSVDWANRDEIMEDFAWEKFRVFDTGDHRVIYFHQDFVDRFVPDRDTFSRELNDVLAVIRRYYPEEQIARKYHPAHEVNKDVIEVGDEIPIYIPAELLYNERVELYVGISSTAITNIRGGRVISLLDLLSFNSEEIRQRFKERLRQNSRTEIFFPSSLEELDHLVRDVSGRASNQL